MQNLQVIEHDNQRILTTQQLAEFYGATVQKITNNFNNNKKHYILNKHFYRLEGEEKHKFLNLTKIDLGSKNAKFLYLWTERGALLHAKSLNTNEAWQVYEQLVDTYFRAQQLQQALTEVTPSPISGDSSLTERLDKLISLMEKQYSQPMPEQNAQQLALPMRRYMPNALEEAKAFLQELLANGKVPSKEVHAEAESRGISETTLDRAKTALNIDCRERKGFGGDTVVYWQMPKACYDMDELKKKKMLSKDEAAFYIGVSGRTLSDIISGGDFYPLVRLGHNRGKIFINREKLDQWLNEQDGSLKAVR